jgi:hypothetical protein
MAIMMALARGRRRGNANAPAGATERCRGTVALADCSGSEGPGTSGPRRVPASRGLHCQNLTALGPPSRRSLTRREVTVSLRSSASLAGPSL